MLNYNEGASAPVYLEPSEEIPTDSDPLLFEKEQPQSAQSIFSEIDSEIQTELVDEDEPEVVASEHADEGNDESQQGGDKLNQVYQEYLGAPNQDNLDRLLIDVENYARRITTKVCLGFGNFEISEYFAQTVKDEAMLHVWRGLGGFKGKSKFSSWVYEIIQNIVFTRLNYVSRRKDINLKILDWKDYTAPIVGVRNAGNTGAALDGGEDSNDDNGGVGAAPVPSQEHCEETENGLNAELDFAKVFSKLSPNDRRVIELYKDGYRPADIGKAFRRDAKWASNQITVLKDLLRHELYICETVLHTCRVSPKPTPVMQTGLLYVEDGDSYRAMQTCRCRKGLTGLEAKTLIKNGGASDIYKCGDDGKPLLIHGEIWAAQAVRTPRVGLSSSRVHVEKAYGIGQSGNNQVARNIELEYEIAVEGLRKLIVPFRPDPWEGRVIFTGFSEGRAEGTFSTYEWQQPEPKPIPERQTTVIEENAHCLRCGAAHMAVSEFADGTQKHDCPCGYLAVFRKREPSISKSQVASVLVLERDTNPPASSTLAAA